MCIIDSHKSISPATGFKINSTGNPSNDSSYFNNTAPTTSVFTVGTSGDTNKSSQTHISYCFAEKKGYSKFGIYTGQGGAGGQYPFIYTVPAVFFGEKYIGGAQELSERVWELSENTKGMLYG